MWTQSPGSTDRSREEQGRPRQRLHDRCGTKNRVIVKNYVKNKKISQYVGQFILYRTYLFMLLNEQNQSLQLGANLLILV